MKSNKKVHPSEKIHIFKKGDHHLKHYYLKKIFLLIKQRKVVYTLTAFLLVLELYGYGFSVLRKNTDSEIHHPVLQTLERISEFFLTANIVIIVLHLPKNSESFYDFFASLYPEGNKLLGPLLAMKKHHFWRNFFLCNVCIGTLIALNASFYLINFGWDWYKYIVFRDVEFYLNNLVLLLLLALARKLELRFAELNEMLLYKTERFLKTNSSKKTEVASETGFAVTSEHFYSVRTFRIMHYDLCNLVKRFNDMFGRILLSSIVFSIANILAKITFIIEFSVSTRNQEEKKIWGYFLGIVCFWIFANIGQAFLFSFYGEQLTKEGEKTTRICFYLLNKVPFPPRNEDETLVHEELTVLAFQSYSKIPALSAGGFFDINFRVLGLMISSVTSYLMVIIQFLLRQNNN